MPQQAENLQTLQTQRSQKSLSQHQQQTYHVIPTTVNQNPPQGNQSHLTNKTQANLSIINRSENQIPFVEQKQLSKDHKQNQYHHVQTSNTRIDHVNVNKQDNNQAVHEQKAKIEDKNKEVIDAKNRTQESQVREKKNDGIKEMKNQTQKQIISSQTNYAVHQATINNKNSSKQNIQAQNNKDNSKKQLKAEVKSQQIVNQVHKTQQKQQKLHNSQLPFKKEEQSKKEQIEQLKAYHHQSEPQSLKQAKKQQKSLNSSENNNKQSQVKNLQKEINKQSSYQKKQHIIGYKQQQHQVDLHNQWGWGYLLSSFIQKVDKLKQQKQKRHIEHHSHKHQKKIDLNLQLGSSLTSSQNDYQNRIKLEFNLYSPSQQITSQDVDNMQNHPIKLSFQYNNSTKQQPNLSSLSNKLEQATKHFDQKLFSFTINKARIEFYFSIEFISEHFNIDKNTLKELKNVLLNLSKHHNDAQKNNTENLKNQNLLSTSFCQLITSYPLKTIEPIKFLQFLLGGFKLKLFNQSRINNTQKQSQSVEEILYHTLLSFFPQQVRQYIRKVSGGNGNIKFRSVKNLTNLLSRLGINEMLGETPTVKELLAELMGHFRALFCNKQQQGNTKNNKLLQLWKIFQTVFQELDSNGLEIQLTLFSQLSVRLLLECKSQRINNLYQQIIAH